MLGNVFPSPGKIVGVLVIALGAIWLSNNVAFINNLVAPRPKA